MRKYWLMSVLAALVVATAHAEDVDWSLTVTPNDGAAVNWLAVTTPTHGDAEAFALNSFDLFVGFLKTGGTTYGVSTSYMIISRSKESASSVAASDVVAISTNAPTPANDYATYTFDNAVLQPGTTYYLYWVTSNKEQTTYSTTTQRLGLYKQTYSPGMYFGNSIQTAWSPAYKATLTVTTAPSGEGTETPGDGGETDQVDNVRQVLFNNGSSSIPYRIPAMAQAPNGDLFALSDYRQGKADIGYGAVDVYARISRDNGATWGDEFCIAGSTAITGRDSQYYGDASIVADRESDEVLVMLVSGTVGYFASTRNNPMRMAYARATYNKESDEWTWTKPVDITSSLYEALPKAQSLFFTSGKICQSTQIKVGSHYRIYSGVCVRYNNTNYNFVMYSDNFGETWKVLGDSQSPSVITADECKCEELPNGNVVVSTRVAKGRKWTIFEYTDKENAEGSWSQTISPSSTNDGIYNSSDTNPCNGEILLVDAIRKSDNAEVRLALQSLATNRTNVTIWYKALDSEDDYNTAANFAKSWEGKYQVSSTTSCYSTMIRQQGDRIGFYFEENSYNSGYDEVYYRYTLETITNGAYSLKPETSDGEGQEGEGTNPTDEKPLRGDINGDGRVSIADVTELVNIILSAD